MHRIARLPSIPCLVLVVALLAACAPAPIYPTPANAVAATPAQVAATPARYAGGQVIWGGRVVGVHNFADHSEVELLAYPLDNSQRPTPGDSDNGRFITLIPGYVESLNYPSGALMTVRGTLDGTRAGKVGDADYVFPLVNAVQSHVWTAAELGRGHNNFSFGVGVGVVR